MYQLRHIESLDDPALVTYRTMRRPVEHARQGIFVAEGEKVVRRLLQDHRFGVVSVLLPTKWLGNYEPLLRARPDQFEVFVAEQETLKALIGFHLYQGVLAVGRIPAPPPLETVLEQAPHPLLLVAADGLTNSENVGALVRNAAAFRAHAVIAGETCATPWLRRSVRSSMGAVFQIPIVESSGLVATLQELRKRGIHVVAAHPHVDGRILAQANLARDCCLVMGSEGTGIRPEVLAECDDAVAIRMPPTVDSLNVTSATSVFLYEANRQRGWM
jgi:tRNA G18 (ribose-2'-O)-methylase SpoU